MARKRKLDWDWLDYVKAAFYLILAIILLEPLVSLLLGLIMPSFAGFFASYPYFYTYFRIAKYWGKPFNYFLSHWYDEIRMPDKRYAIDVSRADLLFYTYMLSRGMLCRPLFLLRIPPGRSMYSSAIVCIDSKTGWLFVEYMGQIQIIQGEPAKPKLLLEVKQ